MKAAPLMLADESWTKLKINIFPKDVACSSVHFADTFGFDLIFDAPQQGAFHVQFKTSESSHSLREITTSYY